VAPVSALVKFFDLDQNMHFFASLVGSLFFDVPFRSITGFICRDGV
jgi:hypothetical protein